MVDLVHFINIRVGATAEILPKYEEKTELRCPDSMTQMRQKRSAWRNRPITLVKEDLLEKPRALLMDLLAFRSVIQRALI